MTAPPDSIDAYIAPFPTAIQTRLQALRGTIREAAPGATETINYTMPTFKLHGKNLVHFGGYDKHIGFYPAPSAMTAFEERLTAYKRAKGSVQFPHDQPLPLELVREMVLFRVAEDEAKAAAAKKR